MAITLGHRFTHNFMPSLLQRREKQLTGARSATVTQMVHSNHTYDCPKFSTFHPQRPAFRPPLHLPPLASSSPKFNESKPPLPKRPSPDHCILYNKNDGNCPYGDRCKKIHMCTFCKTRGHPVSRCPSKSN